MKETYKEDIASPTFEWDFTTSSYTSLQNNKNNLSLEETQKLKDRKKRIKKIKKKVITRKTKRALFRKRVIIPTIIGLGLAYNLFNAAESEARNIPDYLERIFLSSENTAKPIEKDNNTLIIEKTKTKTIEDILENIESEELISVGINSTIEEQFNAYKHNSNSTIKIAQAFANNYAHLPGKFTDANVLLKESVAQLKQESNLLQASIFGELIQSYQDAKGAGQFLPIGIADVNEKLAQYQKKDSSYQSIQPINKDLAFSPTIQGAIENIRANVLYKKLNLERLENSDLVNYEYHQGGTNMQRAIRKAKSTNPQKVKPYVGPKGREYVEKINKNKEMYTSIEDFKEHAQSSVATNLMYKHLEKAKNTVSIETKIVTYQEIYDFAQKIKTSKNEYSNPLINATYELARLYQHAQPQKALDLASEVVELAPKKSNYHRNATQLQTKLKQTTNKNESKHIF